MFLLKVVAAIAYISLGLPDSILGLAWPELHQDLGVELDRIGLLTGATFAGYLVSSSLAATLAKRLGLGWLLVTSSLAMSTVMLAYALASNFYVLIAFGFLGGLGGGAIDAALNSYTAHRFTIRMVNWLHGCWGIGAFAGPLLMTAVLSLQWSWRASYFILACALLVTACLLFATRFHWELDSGELDKSELPPEPPSDTSEPDDFTTANDPTFAQVLCDRQVLGQAFLFFLYTGIESTIGLLFFTWWTQGNAISPGTAGLAITGYWFAFTASRFGLGQLANHWGGERLVKSSALLMPLVALLILFPPMPSMDLAFIVLMGCIISPVFPTWIGLTPQTVRPDFAAQAIGFQVSAAAIGVATIPGLVLFVASRTDLRLIPIALLTNVLAFCLLQTLLLKRNANRSTSALA